MIAGDNNTQPEVVMMGEEEEDAISYHNAGGDRNSFDNNATVNKTRSQPPPPPPAVVAEGQPRSQAPASSSSRVNRANSPVNSPRRLSAAALPAKAESGRGMVRHPSPIEVPQTKVGRELREGPEVLSTPPRDRKMSAKPVYRSAAAPDSPPPDPPVHPGKVSLRSIHETFDQIAHSGGRAAREEEEAAVGAAEQTDGRGVNDMAIRVVVRKRPISRKELGKGEKDIAEILGGGRVLIHELKAKVDLTKYVETMDFLFDDAFNESETNEVIYQRTVKHLVASVFEGGKATCFAYGQTGSGKTYTMMGASISAAGSPVPVIGYDSSGSNVGLYVLAAKDVFSTLALPGYSRFSVKVSCFEIYGGKLFDLLNDRSIIKCLEDGQQQVQLLGLSEHPIGALLCKFSYVLGVMCFHCRKHARINGDYIQGATA